MMISVVLQSNSGVEMLHTLDILDIFGRQVPHRKGAG